MEKKSSQLETQTAIKIYNLAWFEWELQSIKNHETHKTKCEKKNCRSEIRLAP